MDESKCSAQQMGRWFSLTQSHIAAFVDLGVFSCWYAFEKGKPYFETNPILQTSRPPIAPARYTFPTIKHAAMENDHRLDKQRDPYARVEKTEIQIFRSEISVCACSF